MLKKIMYPGFLYKINDRFDAMPLLLKITCTALFVLGFFQLLALIYPVVAPKIEGTSITKPMLVVLVGLVHILVGYGIYIRKKWCMVLIIFLPLFQYGTLYLEIGLPPKEALQTNAIMSLGWSILWIGYYYLGNAKSYFMK